MSARGIQSIFSHIYACNTKHGTELYTRMVFTSQRTYNDIFACISTTSKVGIKNFFFVKLNAETFDMELNIPKPFDLKRMIMLRKYLFYL